MIGPAEIEEMMTELAERASAAEDPFIKEPCWPLFVGDNRGDEAGRQLIGSCRERFRASVPKPR